MNRWHWNCNDCKTTGEASGMQQAHSLAIWLARTHADRMSHVVRVWPRGQRDKTERYLPAIGDTDVFRSPE